MNAFACRLALAALVAAGAAPVSAGPARERLDDFLSGLETLTASFRQVLLDEGGKPGDESTGTFYLARPDRFRWDYREPFRQLIIADGRDLWLYEPDLLQVTTRTQSEALDATPASLLASARPVDETFEVTELDVAADGIAWLALAPRASGGSFEQIRIGLDERGLRSMELKDGFGQITRLEFSAVERNPALDSALFRFTPPAGVDVVKGQ